MTDERIRLCRSVEGTTQIRVDRLLLQDEGREWLYTELGKRGLLPGDLGEPVTRGRHVIIPIRKESE
jgi:hypothetical protein